jgi:hypothetical protein
MSWPPVVKRSAAWGAALCSPIMIAHGGGRIQPPQRSYSHDATARGAAA